VVPAPVQPALKLDQRLPTAQTSERDDPAAENKNLRRFPRLTHIHKAH
jgi:hypothetical protein